MSYIRGTSGNPASLSHIRGRTAVATGAWTPLFGLRGLPRTLLQVPPRTHACPWPRGRAERMLSETELPPPPAQQQPHFRYPAVFIGAGWCSCRGVIPFREDESEGRGRALFAGLVYSFV